MTDFFHAAPKTDRETSGGETVTMTETDNQKLSRGSALSDGCSSRDAVPESGAHLNSARRGNFTQQQLAKATAFWKRKTALRKTPGNCGRCGKPNPDAGSKARCPKCRAYQRRYKLLRRMEPVVVSNAELRELRRRVESLEQAVAAMQVDRKRCYLLGYRQGKKNENTRRFMPDVIITKQELATMNHAYYRRQ